MPVVVRSVKSSVDFKWDVSKLGKIERNIQEGLFDLAFHIAAQARRNSPILTGALRNSIRVEAEGDDVLVKAGGGISAGNLVKGKGNAYTLPVRVVNYAWIREQSNRLHPDKAHYMEKAQKAIMTGNFMKQYFGKVTK